MTAQGARRGLRFPHQTTIALFVLVIAAFALRVYRLDWDDGRLLHPDELHVVEVIANRISLDWPVDWANLRDPERSRLNPRSDDPLTGKARQYAYGALPLLVTEAVATTLEAATGTPWTRQFGGVHRVGRALTALLDTGTVALIFLLGRRLASARIGLAAAALYAFAPMTLQLAHFFTTDSWLAFFVSLTLWLSVRAAESGSRRAFFLAGAGFGLAMASKGSVAALSLVIVVAAVWDARARSRTFRPAANPLVSLVGRLALAAVGAVVAFGVFEPYAIARPRVYFGQLATQSRIVRGALDVAFTRQYVDTFPIAYQAKQLFLWGVGPATALLTFAGVAVLAVSTWRRPTAGKTLLLVWLVTQGLVVGLPETKFIRYAAPLLPALMIGAALALDRLGTELTRRLDRRAAAAAVVACFIGVGLWTAGFSSVYAARHTRLEASRWIYANVPNGSAIGVETWDEALPVPLGIGLTSWDFQFRLVPIELYRDRPPAVVADELYQTLTRVDYIVLASDRVRRGVGHLPWRYPVQNRYYELLGSGQLGFTRVARFERAPGVGPLRLDDRAADESLINYDHPRVAIYRKERLIDRSAFDALVGAAVERPFDVARHWDASTLELDRPVGALEVVDDARWSAGVTSNSLIAALFWVGLLLLLQGVGYPLASFTLGRAADGGWGFARLIALVVAGYLVWLGASLGAIAFRAIWAAVALVVVAGFWALRGRIQTSANVARDRRRNAIGSEAAFWSVFGFFLALRLANPDSWHPYWGGEKPMEFAHLNALLRSAHFPPFDPWFADGVLNYYYYGLYLIAFCAKLTGIPSELVFNLAQPTVMGLLAAGGFSLAATLGRAGARGRWTGPVAGAFGVVVLLGIGNLEAARQVVSAFPDSVGADFGRLTWPASRTITGGITEFPYFTGLYADLHAHVVALPITVLIIALCYATAARPRQLTVSISEARHPGSARWELGARLALTALALGTLSVTNAWDAPVYAALTIVGLFMATRALPSLLFRIALTGALSALLGLLAYGLFLPFHRHYVALFGSLSRVETSTDLWQFLNHLGGLLVIVGCGLVAMLVRIRLNRLSLVDDPFSPVLAIGGILAAVALFGGPDRELYGLALVAAVTALMVAAAWPARPWLARSPRVLAGGLALAGIAAIGFAATGRQVLGLSLAMAAGAVVVWLQAERSEARFIGAMVAAAMFVAAGVEVVYLVDDLDSTMWRRMNTIFKFYNQVWVLLSLTAAPLLAMMSFTVVRVVRDAEAKLEAAATPSDAPAEGVAPISRIRRQPALSARWSVVGVALGATVILGSLAYPVLATGPRLDLRFPDHPGVGTLNALAWMEEASIPLVEGGELRFAEDRAVIAWFNDEVAGTPVIAEASIGPYRCNGSRISVATGLPTIIGWERHESQQRYRESLAGRVDDVRTLYLSIDPDEKQDILNRYGVAYVVVGELERAYPRISGNDCLADGSEAGIAAFERMVGTTLEVAFQAGSTVVYRVTSVGR